MLKNDNDDERQALVRALTERGVSGAAHVVGDLDDEQVAASAQAVLAYDNARGDKSTGLLVYLLRQELAPPASCEPAPPRREPTRRLLTAVRGSCRSPDGFDRDEARDMFASAAKRHGLSVDELIDLAMGVDWTETPPHPALDRNNPDRAAEYERWVAGNG